MDRVTKLASKAFKSATWCTPLTIYMVIAVAGLVAILRKPATRFEHARQVLIGLLWVLFWSFLMYTSCSHGKRGIAWVILLLPVILWAVMSVLTFVGLMRSTGKCVWTVGQRTVCTDTILQEDCTALFGTFTQGSKCSSGVQSGVVRYADNDDSCAGGCNDSCFACMNIHGRCTCI